MDITPLIPEGRLTIDGYGDGGFRIAGESLTGGVLLFPDIVYPWNATSTTTLTPEDFAPILARQADVELLLIGTGATIAPFPAPIRQTLRKAGVACEVMDTGAACRTYHVLLAEDRRLAAALLPV